MSELYSGSSESFQFLSDCYLDYAKEVISRRAIPDLRDGQKKVSRRILYSAYKNKKSTMQKCVVFVSDALKLHPHGDGAVYGALALMTDENGSCNMPTLHALGNLGKCFSSKSPAGMRYPKAILNENAMDFFKDKDVMTLVPAEEGEGDEPEVLNALYPVVLVNGTMGIAVSVATKIPSFNFGDVIDLAVKYLENGKLEVTDVIVPDFPTGGILVRNETELAKIMSTGKGKLKIRANVEIEGNKILVKEIPFGTTVENIIRKVKESGIKEISIVTNTVGRNSPALVTIECKTKKVVEYVLMELYRRNILQSIFASNIVVTENDVPYIIGVHGIIEKWCKWRESVVVKKFTKSLNDINSELNILDYFVRLVNNEEWKAEYTKRALYSKKADADAYLFEIFPDISQDVCDWIRGRAISAFNNGGKYANRYSDLLSLKEEYEGNLNNPKLYMIKEMQQLKVNKAGQYDRKTEISYTDYKFSRIVESDEIEDDSYCVWSLTRDGFLKKTREKYRGTNVTEEGIDSILCEFEGKANSILVGFDNFGRLLRIKGKDIPYTPYGENGTYLPSYFEATFQEDYKVLYMGLLDGKTRMLVYRDGHVGFLDTSEWVGKNVVKIVSNGVCRAVYDKLLQVYEEDEIPSVLMFADDENNQIKVGIKMIESIPVRGRMSRAKIFPGVVNTKFIKPMEVMDMYTYISEPEMYLDKFTKLKTDFIGDPEELVGGEYLDLCKDFENVSLE